MKQISNDVNILYEDNHIIVCLKPEGLLSQQDETNDLDILTIIKAYLNELVLKEGFMFAFFRKFLKIVPILYID